MSHSAARESFRKEVHLRRASLMPHELGFLTGLLEDGSELELSRAKLKLCEIVNEEHTHVLKTTTTEEGVVTTTTTKSVGVEPPPSLRASQSAPMTPAIPPPSTPLRDRQASEGFGSARRQESLQHRRQSQVHGQIWKAHQNGLAVTQKSSRRSVVLRQELVTTTNRILLVAGSSTATTSTQPLLSGSASGGAGSSIRRRAASVSLVPGASWFTSSNNSTSSLNHRELLSRHGSLSSSGRTRSNSNNSLSSIGSMGSSSNTNNHQQEERLSMSASLNLRRRHSQNGRKQLPPFLQRRASSGATFTAPHQLRRRNSSASSNSNNSSRTKKKGEDKTKATTTTTCGVPPFPVRRKLSSVNSDLLGIPEEGDKTQSFDSVTPPKPSLDDNNHNKDTKATSCSATQHDFWNGTNYLTEEEKKMSEEEMDKISKQEQEEETSHQQIPVLIRRASVNNYGGEGMEIEGAGLLGLVRVEKEEMCSVAADMIESEVSVEDDDLSTLPPTSSDEEKQNNQQKPAMIMRRASVNVYNGAGMEISDWDAQDDLEERHGILDAYRQYHQVVPTISDANSKSIPSAAGPSLPLLGMSHSFDACQSIDRQDCLPHLKEAPFTLYRSLSEDELSSMLVVAHQSKRNIERVFSEDTEATTNSDEDGGDLSHSDFEYDAWVDAPEQMGGVLDLIPFRILGTSAEDVDSHPHVLSPPLMESIQAFFPFAHTSDNFWMKYSMVRDGASMYTLLQRARGSQFSILALETVDGEVMGAVTTEPWRKTWSYFGGGESFLWRMRHSRHTKCHSIIDQAHLESEIEVFPYTGENQCIQFCTSQNMAVGGGTAPEVLSPTSDGGATKTQIREHEWGHGIHLDNDLMHGTSAPCITFGSPSLSESHSDGSRFEIINLELWTMTPCYHLADAEKLELGRLFLEGHSFNADD